MVRSRVGRVAAALIIGLIVTPLAGCHDENDENDYRRELVEIGKECHDSGGEWVRYTDGWGAGQYCRFAGEKESPE